MIEGQPPRRWRDLQENAALVLHECGMTVETEQAVSTARGVVSIDVVAVNHDASPPATIMIECKRWRRRVPKSVVHSFLAGVADAGANLGMTVSSAGFQSGAQDAARFNNVRLVDWPGFEALRNARARSGTPDWLDALWLALERRRPGRPRQSLDCHPGLEPVGDQ